MDEVQTSDVSAAAAKIKEGAAELHSAVMDHGQEKFERLCKAADETVRENPYGTLAVASGLGALIGVLLARR